VTSVALGGRGSRRDFARTGFLDFAHPATAKRLTAFLLLPAFLTFAAVAAFVLHVFVFFDFIFFFMKRKIGKHDQKGKNQNPSEVKYGKVQIQKY